MNAETYLDWLRRQGRQIYHTQSSYWYTAGPRVLQAFPHHWLIQPSEQELRKLLIGKGIIALRYSTPLQAPEGKASYHAVLHNPYNLEGLRAQARNGVKKGLNICQVERISFERLADEGWNLQQDTLERQGRLKSMNQAEWQHMCMAAADLPGFEAWASLVQGELAAALITVRVEDTFCVPYAASHRKFLNQHVNNALFYSVSTNFLAREGVQEIFFCPQSLDAPCSVDEFKFRMGFMAKPVRQRVVFHPLLAPFVNQSLHAWVLKLITRYPESTGLRKAEGMVRFNLLGRYPILSQEWPEVLAEEKTRILSNPVLRLS